MPVQLTANDISDLKSQGFSDAEISKAVRELESEELDGSYNNTKSMQDPRINASHSGFNSRVSDDVARWQLELNDILEKAEHVLKGDIVKFENGSTIWARCENPKENTLNDYGVQLIMKCLTMYINRNTILSDFTGEETRLKTLDFAKELNNLIFMKSEEMGMDNEDKRKEYPMIVREMADIVHSAYARAKDGRERESYRKMITVSQQNQAQQMVGGMGMPQPIAQKRGILNPARYFGSGKYHWGNKNEKVNDLSFSNSNFNNFS